MDLFYFLAYFRVFKEISCLQWFGAHNAFEEATFSHDQLKAFLTNAA